DVRDLARFGEAGEVAGHLVHDLLRGRADAVHVDLGVAELHAKVGGVAGLGDELGGVQQRLGRDAADVQAGAAGPVTGVDERDLEALVGGEEGGGVAAGAAAEDGELRFNHFGHGWTLRAEPWGGGGDPLPFYLRFRRANVAFASRVSRASSSPSAKVFTRASASGVPLRSSASSARKRRSKSGGGFTSSTRRSTSSMRRRTSADRVTFIPRRSTARD